MLKRFRCLAPRLCAAAVATALLAVLGALGYFRYENSDDALLVKAFMGFEGPPAAFTLYTHTLLARLLAALSAAWTGVAWFSVFQLALVWLSCAAVVSAAMRIARDAGRSSLIGLLTGAIFVGVYASFAACRLTYTTTAALAGAAAVWQTLAISRRGSGAASTLLSFLPALALLLCAYSLRQISALPPLAFIALILGWQALPSGEKAAARERSYVRPLACACALAVALGALIVVRAVELGAPEARSFIDWHQARIALFDYTSFERDASAALHAGSGLSPETIQLIRQWYFMDSQITTEALQAMAAAYAGEARPDALGLISAFFAAQPRYQPLAGMLPLMLALCLLVGGRRGATLRLAALLALLGGGLMLYYLAAQGRLLPRAVDSVLLPCAAVLAGLSLIAGTGRGEAVAPRARRMGLITLCALLCVTGAWSLWRTRTVLSDRPDAVSLQREDELERYALSRPDWLILRAPDLLRDTRLFPDVSAGTPQNILIWGDWSCRTPSWDSRLTAYGFDPARFSAADWLDGPILFATADDTPPDALLRYLTQGVGMPVRAVKHDDSGTLRLFRFEADLSAR